MNVILEENYMNCFLLHFIIGNFQSCFYFISLKIIFKVVYIHYIQYNICENDMLLSKSFFVYFKSFIVYESRNHYNTSYCIKIV